MAAMQRSIFPGVGGFDIERATEVGDHPAGALGPIFAGIHLQVILGRLPFGPGGTFGLDLFDTPALLAGQLAFAHATSGERTMPGIVAFTFFSVRPAARRKETS
ncbi:hypothetical protein GCM10027040_24760 [Halomonas shantousis]